MHLLLDSEIIPTISLPLITGKCLQLGFAINFTPANHVHILPMQLASVKNEPLITPVH